LRWASKWSVPVSARACTRALQHVRELRLWQIVQTSSWIGQAPDENTEEVVKN
jgi:hypothetical protein